ncbi:MAG: hypothetical protein PUK42_03480 [Prevotellaceae bacterium]|nr:hypothetical protein [Prevotellaceae bacterium]
MLLDNYVITNRQSRKKKQSKRPNSAKQKAKPSEAESQAEQSRKPSRAKQKAKPSEAENQPEQSRKLNRAKRPTSPPTPFGNGNGIKQFIS